MAFVHFIAVLVLAVVAVNCDVISDYSTAHRNVSTPSTCVLPADKVDLDGIDATWDALTASQQWNVRKCHSLFQPKCYGWTRFADFNAPEEAMKGVCYYYYDLLKPCCSGVDPYSQSKRYLLQYCPLYVANCLSFESYFQELKNNGTFSAPRFPPYRDLGDMSTFVYEDCTTDIAVRGQSSTRQFSCSQDATVKTAAFVVPDCVSLQIYASISEDECETRSTFQGDVKKHKREGCKKYHAKCKNVQHLLPTVTNK